MGELVSLPWSWSSVVITPRMSVVRGTSSRANTPPDRSGSSSVPGGMSSLATTTETRASAARASSWIPRTYMNTAPAATPARTTATTITIPRAFIVRSFPSSQVDPSRVEPNGHHAEAGAVGTGFSANRAREADPLGAHTPGVGVGGQSRAGFGTTLVAAEYRDDAELREPNDVVLVGAARRRAKHAAGIYLPVPGTRDARRVVDRELSDL